MIVDNPAAKTGSRFERMLRLDDAVGAPVYQTSFVKNNQLKRRYLLFFTLIRSPFLSADDIFDQQYSDMVLTNDIITIARVAGCSSYGIAGVNIAVHLRVSHKTRHSLDQVDASACQSTSYRRWISELYLTCLPMRGLLLIFRRLGSCPDPTPERTTHSRKPHPLIDDGCLLRNGPAFSISAVRSFQVGSLIPCLNKSRHAAAKSLTINILYR